MTVPMLDGTVSASPPRLRSSTSAAVTTSATPYTVRAGDSLAGIANRYGLRLGALLQANSLTITSIIHPGDELTLPAGARTTPSAAATTPGSAPAATTAAAAATTYVVKSGDALAGIAWKHGVKLGALVKANNLTTASVIIPGRC